MTIFGIDSIESKLISEFITCVFYRKTTTAFFQSTIRFVSRYGKKQVSHICNDNTNRLFYLLWNDKHPTHLCRTFLTYANTIYSSFYAWKQTHSPFIFLTIGKTQFYLFFHSLFMDSIENVIIINQNYPFRLNIRTEINNEIKCFCPFRYFSERASSSHTHTKNELGFTFF